MQGAETICDGLNICGYKKILERRIEFSEATPQSAQSEGYRGSDLDKKSNEDKIQSDPGLQRVSGPGPQLKSEWQKTYKVGAGIYNEGNTCYINQALQCLINTPILANYLLSGEHSSTCKISSLCWACELERITRASLTSGGSTKTIRAFAFVRNIHIISSAMTIGFLQDAHEFLRLLIHEVHKALLKNSGVGDLCSKKGSLMHSIFGCHIRSRVTCQTCKSKRDTYDLILDFSLSTARCSSLNEAFQSYTRVECLSDLYKCSSCNTLQPTSKHITIHTPPRISTIHFKRFSYISKTTLKISNPLSYPETLDLAPFMTKRPKHPIIYKLYALILHLGQIPHSGHYLAYVRSSNGSWYEYDDSRVTQIPLSTVLNNKYAYVLLYRRVDSSSSESADPPTTSNPSKKKRRFDDQLYPARRKCH